MACIKRLSCKFCVSGMSLCGSSLWMVLLYFKLFHFRVWFNWLIIGCYLVWDCSFWDKLITLVYLQVVANCLHSLQEIWTLEAANSEAAAREIETLYSKPVVFYLLNKWVSTFLGAFLAIIQMWIYLIFYMFLHTGSKSSVSGHSALSLSWHQSFYHLIIMKFLT